MKTEQGMKMKKSKATEGAVVKTASESVTFNKLRVKQFRVNIFCEACIILRTASYGLEIGQARKSARGMPWHQEPMKDATSCEKLRGAANKP